MHDVTNFSSATFTRKQSTNPKFLTTLEICPNYLAIPVLNTTIKRRVFFLKPKFDDARLQLPTLQYKRHS